MKPYTNLPTPTYIELILDIQRMTSHGWSAKIITKVVRRRYGVEICVEEVRDLVEKYGRKGFVLTIQN